MEDEEWMKRVQEKGGWSMEDRDRGCEMENGGYRSED